MNLSIIYNSTYFKSKHGILDALKATFGLIAWISALCSSGWLINFFFTWSMVSFCFSLISTYLFCLGKVQGCFSCVGWCDFMLVCNCVIGVVYLVACICGIISATGHLLNPSYHTADSIATSFGCFVTVLHFLDAYFYRNEKIIGSDVHV